MRAKRYATTESQALAILAAAPAVHVAGLGDRGQPLLRTLNGVAVDGTLSFHGGARGEKTELTGPVVVSAERIIAQIPSWMIDPERACPATTFYESAQLHGVMEVVDDPEVKARYLEALMLRFQPEGRYAPITAADPRYAKSVRGTRVLRVRPQRLVGRRKLGQGRDADYVEKVLRGLWERGDPGDMAAIEAIRAAHPDKPDPFEAPEGLRVCLGPGEPDRIRQAVALVADRYWNTAMGAPQLAIAHANSAAWVALEDRASGRLVATARAVSDRGKRAWIYDVSVDDAWQGRGLGRALMRTLLDHPAVRQTQVMLVTRDAQGFCAALGFRERAELPGPYRRTQMIRPARGCGSP